MVDVIRVYGLKTKIEKLLGHDDARLESLRQALKIAHDAELEFISLNFERLVHVLRGYGSQTSLAQVVDLVVMLGGVQLAL
jgi:hypothetical protein